ncbi:MAG: metal-dependent transcriptional regulator [Halorhabdus sp.]
MSSETQTAASTTRSPTLSELERRVARYLFAISDLSERGEERITTGEIREYLDVAPATVTEMVAKLDEQGLVEYEKYRGVVLTEHGSALATRVAWRYCVVSTFFDSVLDTTLDDQTAFEIGYALPRDGVFSLRDLVSAPCHGLCPESTGDVDECVTC